MALPNNKNYDLSRERGLLIVDNGATRTLTRSLFNMSNVRKEIVKIQLAGDKMFIKSTHSGRKTHYALDATGTIRPITTEAFYVPDLDQDLLAGRALVQSKFRIVMDEDQSISGLFPVVNGQIDPATGFPFADSDGLFFIETVPITESKYLTMSGYKLWHRRLGHSTHQTIKDTIPHVKGLHELEKIRMEPHVDCPACMVGKAKLQPYPKTKDHAKRPLERVYVDLVSASVKSIEGYEYALIITDDATMYRWAARGAGRQKRSRLTQGFRAVSETARKPCVKPESVFFWKKRSQQTCGQPARGGHLAAVRPHQFKTPTCIDKVAKWR